MQLIYEAHPAAVRSATTDWGRLPIHYLLATSIFESENDEATNKLRFLLSKCPESVALLDTPPANSGQQPRSPYMSLQLTLAERFRIASYPFTETRNMNAVLRRLVLRAMPSLNPQELADLNYEARRMGLFLGTWAMTSVGSAPSLFHRLRESDASLFEEVVSFL